MDSLPKVQRSRNQSAVWSGIVAVWKDFENGLGKIIRNGRNTYAWQDCWSPVDSPLKYFVDRNMHLLDIDARVCSFTTLTGQWDRAKWESFLPTWVVDKIMMVAPPTTNGDDVICWRNAPDGNFSVKSAYDRIYHQQNLNSQPHWRHLWHWGIPERVKFFMWQVFHERLPTNVTRARHIPNVLNTCPFQCESEESILHVLRDCEQAQRVWTSLTDTIYYSMFFSGCLQEWLRWNMQHSPGNRRTSRRSWQRVFSTTCWLLWKNRCSQAFEEIAEKPQEIVHRYLFHLSEGAESGRLHRQIFHVPERGVTHWEPPDPDFVRIDVDGSVLNEGQAACGGVIRDHHGTWIRGFQQKLGLSFPTAAEIHAIYTGLQICKLMGLSKIRLFTDSLQAIHLLRSSCPTSHPLYDVILATRSIIFSDWDLQISHSYREIIRCADYLVGQAHGNRDDFVELGSSPLVCTLIFSQECGPPPRDHSVRSDL